jgi:uroporphyrinogen-III decarboxylase
VTEVIQINVPYEEILARQERIAKTKRFEIPDRVAVIPAINYRTLLPKIGVRFRDYYSDPEVMLRSQILGQKWLMENIKTDVFSVTGAWTGGWTDFQNTTEASAFGVEVDFPENDIPVANERGWVRTDRDLRRLESFDFINNGLNGRQIEYRQAMIRLADKFPVRFVDGPVFYPGANPALTHTSNGPFTNGSHLMGSVEMFTAIIERTDFVHELFRIITDKILEWLDFCWEEEQIPGSDDARVIARVIARDLAWTDDLSAYLSADTWREMVLPYNRRIRDHFEWASLHMCGKTDHLLEIFTDELKINEFQGFGWNVDLEKVRQVMGGRVVLLGNVNPLTIAQGTPEQVKAETRRVIEKLAPCRGLIIQDGNNIAPESPVENINAMMEAAEEYDRY